jgi:hypothetical protein
MIASPQPSGFARSASKCIAAMVETSPNTTFDCGTARRATFARFFARVECQLVGHGRRPVAQP